MPLNLTGSNSTALSPDAQYNFPALIFGILLIIVIICGNLLVCLSVYTEKALKTTTNYFIVSLAVADLLLAVLVLPLFVYAEFQGGIWSLNMTLCDALMSMDVMLCTASIFNLCAISVDRFIAVSVPLNYDRKHVDQRQAVLLCGTWVLALAVASPVIFGINAVPERSHSECKLEDDNYVIYSSVCSFFIPCPLMLLLYFGMFRGLRRWEEARRAKLRSSMLTSHKLQEAAATLAPPLAPPLAASQPLPRAPSIEREVSDPKLPPATEGDLARVKLPPATEGDLARVKLPPATEGDLARGKLPPAVGHRSTELKLEELDQDSDPDQKAALSPGYTSQPVPALAYPNQNHDPERLRSNRGKINRRERKAMRVLPVVVGAFLLCWTPFFVVHTLRAMCHTCDVPSALMSTVTWLGYVNSALNPVIYTIFNTEFRRFFKKFLPRCC